MFWNKLKTTQVFGLLLTRKHVWLLICSSVLLLVIIGARLPQDIRSLSTIEEDRTGWTLSQVEAGFYQLSATLAHEMYRETPDSEQIRLRTEIAISRLDIFNIQKNRELFSTHDEAADWYTTIDHFEKQSILIVDKSGLLSTEDVAALNALTDSVIPKIRSLSVAGFVVRTNIEGERRISATQQIERFGILAIVLLIGLTAVLLYLEKLLKRAKQKDAELSALATRLSATLESSLDGVVIASEEGKIIDFNETATRVFGWSQDEVLGKYVNETISLPLDQLESWAIDNLHLRFPKIHNFGDRRFESLALRKNGAQFPVEVVVTTLHDKSGEVNLIAFKDISEQKISEDKIIAAREEAERTNQAKTQFLRAMSHEMRTPLTVISGVLELLSLENLNAKEAKYVNSAAVSSDMLIALINDALDITRVETGDIALNPEVFCLHKTSQQAVLMIEPLAHEKGLDVSLEFEHAINDNFFADKVRLTQILTNLLSNALKYTAKGSIKVVVTGKKALHGTRTRFQVIDTGLGIPNNQQDKIFEYFVTTADNHNEKKIRSDGLGLPLSRKIARLLGGDISIDSHSGAGSTFTLELFLEKAKIPASPNCKKIANNQTPMSILVVEDDEQSFNVLESLLTKLNHKVEHARHGAEGVEKAAKTRFELILMDVHMPILDGFEATSRIRDGDGLNKLTTIVGLTAQAMESISRKADEAGMNTIHSKPIPLLKLQEILKGIESTSEANLSSCTDKLAEEKKWRR